ncbi:MAG: hypothetical protein WBW31_14425 [Candidatus Sulfotelmatobacter sp.]
MPSKRERGSSRQLVLSSVDHLGRRIAPEVLDVAQRIAPRSLLHGEKILGDPAMVLTLLEEVAATVTLAIEKRIVRGKPPIEDLDGYVYRSFMNRINDEERHQPRLLNLGDIEWKAHVRRTDLTPIERKLLLDELLEGHDLVTLDIIVWHYAGQKWREIGAACGISATAARLRFRKAMLQIRNKAEPKKDFT